MMSSASAPVFTIVSVVCTHLASFTPRRLIQVRIQIETSAMSRCGVSPSWIAFAEEDVLSAGARVHRRELAVGERAHYRDDARRKPGKKQPEWRANRAADVGGDDEDSGADHRAGDEHRRVRQAQSLDEPAARFS